LKTRRNLLHAGDVPLKTDSQRFFRFSCESVLRRGGRVAALSQGGGHPLPGFFAKWRRAWWTGMTSTDSVRLLRK